VKHDFPHVTKVHYFTDGCAAQYKNRYNFVNICHHFVDFNLDCEWNFFATSHGKGACDGIGAAVKRSTAKASLQRPVHAQIVTAKDMFSHCVSTFQNIHFFFVSDDEITIAREHLQQRFSAAITIKGTQRFHRFKPISSTKIEVYDLSSNRPLKQVDIAKNLSGENTQEDDDPRYPLGTFLACIASGSVWVGVIVEESPEFDDYRIKVLHPSGCVEKYFWPDNEEIMWMTQEAILCSVDCKFIPSLGYYQLGEGDLEKIRQCHTKRTQ